jgi:iron complex transport system ATP-binding protein
MSTPLLRAQGVRVSLGGTRVLRDVSLALQPGWTAIVGPNGAGKSTLLRGLAGLQPLEAGQVLLQGRPLQAWTVRERARRMAWLAQQSSVTGELTVRETVRLGRLPHLGLFAEPDARDEAIVQQAMAAAECEAWPDRRLDSLSGGERQRVLLARALAVDAPLLLLDEPTTHLDPPHQVALVRLFRTLALQRTVVSVLHDLPLALQADRLVVMQAGEVRAEGRADDPALHASLSEVFGNAVRIERVGARFMAWPDLD